MGLPCNEDIKAQWPRTALFNRGPTRLLGLTRLVPATVDTSVAGSVRTLLVLGTTSVVALVPPPLLLDRGLLMDAPVGPCSKWVATERMVLASRAVCSV